MICKIVTALIVVLAAVGMYYSYQAGQASVNIENLQVSRINEVQSNEAFNRAYYSDIGVVQSELNRLYGLEADHVPETICPPTIPTVCEQTCNQLYEGNEAYPLQSEGGYGLTHDEAMDIMVHTKD